jgi:hypothetical protein
VSFYLDTATSGTWDLKNASQRMGIATYILWTYIPSVVAVLYGMLWTILDGEVKRIEKYHHLFSPNGSPGASSICLDYHFFWTPIAIVQAVRCRQWAVVLSSTGCVVAVIAVPNIQNYVFNWVIYSGGDLNWGGIYSWQVGLVDPYWAKVLISAVAIDLVCILSLMVLLHRRQTGLQDDPRGIITWVKFTLDSGDESDFGLQHFDSFADSCEIYAKLKDKRFQVTAGTAQGLRVLKDCPASPPGRLRIRCGKRVPQSLRTAWAKIGVTRERGVKWTLRIYQRVNWWMAEYASSMLHLLILIPWILWLVLSLCANLYILAKMTSPEQLTLSNYVLPWSPNVYLVVGVFIQV